MSKLMLNQDKIVANIDRQQHALCQLARDIWANPELACKEIFASRVQADVLKAAGFDVQYGVAELPTAFVASWGEAAPVIGILGEYDALPGLSQQVSSQRSAITKDAPGHGCGHNLLGTAGVGAAIALKEVLEQVPAANTSASTSANTPQGSIRYYGCPAEELGLGKVVMANASVFNDLAAAITWHPASTNKVVSSAFNAKQKFKVSFHGVTAHAAGAPHLGRSALDGVMLMDVGANYLREHIIPEARVHSVITHGGRAVNVVPDYAQIAWSIRAPFAKDVDHIYRRLVDVAKGAALMSGTRYKLEEVQPCHDYLPNKVLGEVMYTMLQKLAGSLAFNDDERAFAKDLQASFPEGARAASLAELATRAHTQKSDVTEPLSVQILRHADNPPNVAGSTDVGEVSYITPTVQLTAACWPVGTPVHSWQAVAASGSSAAYKGMLFAAKAMALTAYELLTQPARLETARAELNAITSL
jgi:aminobenzoyl-glutamate utilization protein B